MFRWSGRAFLVCVAIGSPRLAGAEEYTTCGAEPACQGCASGCGCAPVCKGCVLVPEVIKHPKTIYACKSADFCLPKRSLFDIFKGHHCSSACCSGRGDCCDGCHCDCPPVSCPQCECKARHRMVLLKRIITKDCPGFRCEPVCCPNGGCAAHACQEEAPAPDPMDDRRDMEPKKGVPVPPSAMLSPHRTR